jgi:hypothetical protein
MARVSAALKAQREEALVNYFQKNPMATGREANEFLKTTFGQGMNPNALYDLRRRANESVAATSSVVTTGTTTTNV